MNFWDSAPLPAEWALSRFIDPPHTQIRTTRYLDQELTEANYEVMCSLEGFLAVPHIYRELFQQTKLFTATIQDMVNATMHHKPSKWAETARLIVDYSVIVLRSEHIGFDKFLHSQRESIYWILDDALLRLCLDQWEVNEEKYRWAKTIEPINLALRDAREKLSNWGEADFQAMFRIQGLTEVSPKYLVARFFKQTQKFLRESTRIAEIMRTVKLSGIGQLPVELADIIIADVLEFEKLQIRDLRRAYLRKGKGKA
jgi:hypothetical protein